MKEKLYQAEENFKSALEGYEAQMDTQAFEEFSKQLDVTAVPVQSPLQRFFKSILFKGLMSVLVLGIALVVFRSLGNEDLQSEEKFGIQNESSQLTEVDHLALGDDIESMDASNAQTGTMQKTVQNVVSNPVEADNENSIDNKNDKGESLALNELVETNPKATHTIMTIQGTTTNDNASSSILSSRTTVKSALANNWSVNLETTELASYSTNLEAIQSTKQEAGKATSSFTSDVISKTASKEVLTPPFKKRTVQIMEGIVIRETNLLDSEKSLFTDIGSVKIFPRIERFDRYFYVGIDGGVARELNDATVDDYFEKIIYSDIAGMGYHFRLKFGRQLSKHTALEFTAQMKDNSLKWDLSNGSFQDVTNRVQNIPIFGLRLLNSLPITEKLSLNTSLGYARGLNLPFFSTTRFGLVEPGINQPEEITYDYTYQGTNSKSYGLVEGGVGLDYFLTDRLSFTGSLNYFVGFKTILSNRIDYKVGEGKMGDFEISSKGGFYSVDLGFIYRFKKE